MLPWTDDKASLHNCTYVNASVLLIDGKKCTDGFIESTWLDIYSSRFAFFYNLKGKILLGNSTNV